MIWNFYISHIKLLHFHHKCPFSNAHKNNNNNNNKRTFILWRCRIHWMYERGLARAPNSQLSNDFVLSWLCTFVSSPSRTFFRRKMNDFGTEKSTREDVTKVHRTKRFRLKVTDFKPLGGVFSCGKHSPKEYQCSGHFETKVANETTHNLGVADQKILSDWIFDPFL